MESREVFAGIPLFAEVLSPADLDLLAARVRPCFFAPDAVLMEEADFGASMFAIVDGTVAVSVDDGRGGSELVARLSDGEIVGEMSLMTGARRSATVTAVTAVNALEITKVNLEAILTRAPKLVDAFSEMLEKRQSELDSIHAEAHRWTVLGLTRAEIVARMRAFFFGS